MKIKKATKFIRWIRFKGWDWNELMEAFKLDIDDDDDINLLRLRKYLKEQIGTSKERETVEIIKGYVNAMLKYKDLCAEAPVWEGLLKVGCDSTIIQLTIYLLEYMWT